MFLLLPGDIEQIVVVFGNFNSSKRSVRAGRFAGELRGGLVPRRNQNKKEAHVSDQGWHLRPGRKRRVRTAARESGISSTSPTRNRGVKQRIERHKDGSIKVSGHVVDDVLAGYWEWFTKDGSKMRSGYFAKGKQV